MGPPFSPLFGTPFLGFWGFPYLPRDPPFLVFLGFSPFLVLAPLRLPVSVESLCRARGGSVHRDTLFGVKKGVFLERSQGWWLFRSILATPFQRRGNNRQRFRPLFFILRIKLRYVVSLLTLMSSHSFKNGVSLHKGWKSSGLY